MVRLSSPRVFASTPAPDPLGSSNSRVTQTGIRSNETPHLALLSQFLVPQWFACGNSVTPASVLYHRLHFLRAGSRLGLPLMSGPMRKLRSSFLDGMHISHCIRITVLTMTNPMAGGKGCAEVREVDEAGRVSSSLRALMSVFATWVISEGRIDKGLSRQLVLGRKRGRESESKGWTWVNGAGSMGWRQA